VNTLALPTTVLRWDGDPSSLTAAAGPGGHVVLDLTAVPGLDHDGLAQLVRTRQEVRRHGGQLCLAAPSRVVLTVLHTMRLEAAFPTFADPAAARAWLAAGAEPTMPLWSGGLG
jgi:anti-anti-sigma regulatory factor